MWIKRIFAALIIISCAPGTRAQEKWPSPEVAQMYHDATDQIAMHNLKQAIITYKQILTFVPGNKIVVTELGNAYYLDGDYKLSEGLLIPLLDSPEITPEVYQLIAADQSELKKAKEAKATLSKGLSLFDHSGLLYFQQGKVLMQENDELDAVRSWCDGIERDPDCPLNYREAAMSFFSSEYVLWGLIYGEEYLAMEHDSSGDDVFKKSLFSAWETFFNRITDPVPDIAPTPVEQSITDLYKQLTPVVSDGISTENLTMVQTRFLMRWFARPAQGSRILENPSNNYPIALFRYQDRLIRNGWFDIYQEWLSGKAENSAAYDAWNKFHEGMIASFEHYRADYPFDPVIITQPIRTSDENLRVLFSKKKKR